MTTKPTALRHATKALTDELIRSGSSYESIAEATVNAYLESMGIADKEDKPADPKADDKSGK